MILILSIRYIPADTTGNLLETSHAIWAMLVMRHTHPPELYKTVAIRCGIDGRWQDDQELAGYVPQWR